MEEEQQKRKQDGSFDLDRNEWIKEILDITNTGLWMIQIDENTGLNQLFAAKTMLKLLGVSKKVSPEECYNFWYTRINKGYYAYVHRGLEQMKKGDQLIEIQYLWNHPELGSITVRCCGRAEYAKNGVFKLRGYHQNITQLEQLEAVLTRIKNEIFEYSMSSNIAYLHTDHVLLFGNSRKFKNFPEIWIEQGLVHPDFFETFRAAFERIHRGKMTTHCEIQMKNTEGKYIWIRMELEVRDPLDTRPRIINGTLEDITKQKKIELAYIQEAKMLQVLLSETVAYAKVDLTQNKVKKTEGFWNFYNEMLNVHSYDEILLDSIKHFVHFQDGEAYYKIVNGESLKNAYKKGKTIVKCQFRRMFDDGKMCWVETTIYLMKEVYTDHLIALFCVNNIDSQKKKELERENIAAGSRNMQHKIKKENQFEAVLSEAGDIAYLVDPYTYDLIEGNQAFFDRLGKVRSQCIGKKCYEIIQGRKEPCPFCSKVNWNRKTFYLWMNYNMMLESEFLIKSKLIQWNGKEVMLALTIDIQDDQEVRQRLGQQENKENLVMGGIYEMAQAGSLPHAMKRAMEIIGNYYHSSAVFLLENKGEKYQCMYEWQQKDSFLHFNKQICGIFCEWILSLEYNTPIWFANPEDVLVTSFAAYQCIKEQNIFNLILIPLLKEEKRIGYILAFNNRNSTVSLVFAETFSYFVVQELQKRKMVEELKYFSYYDALTGLLNRNSYARYAQLFKSDEVSSIGMFCLNINGLKLTNDTKGNGAGDRLLQELAEILKKVFSDASVFRMSGDEFMVILKNTTKEQFEEKAVELKEQLKDCSFTVAVGRNWDHDEKDWEECVFQTTELMKVDKQRTYDYHQAVASKRNDLLKGLMIAIDQDEFEVFLQPKKRLEDKEIAGAEALIRYRHPEMGIMPPGKFIPMLEKNHLISYIDLFVLKEVCGLLESWKRKNMPLIPISLNFSRITLLENDLLDRVNEIMAQYDVEPGYVEIEITESIAELGKNIVCSVMRFLKEQGHPLSLDDFGSKYSNLSILTEIPFDVLKLDKSLVNNLTKSSVNEIIVKNVVSMCHDMKVKIVAEGVESLEQEKELIRLGCDIGQGYLYGKPMEIQKFEEKFEDKRRNLR